MSESVYAGLSRREREIMEILYQHGRCTAAEVRGQMAEPPSYSAVRALLRALEEKRHIRHESDGPRYRYFPRQPVTRARRAAVQNLVQTFFDGSPTATVATLLDVSASQLSAADFDRLTALISDARKKGR
jgi:predicted transcriptional regulator